MITKKAGCFLINKETKEIALIYRRNRNDYSFPKGHVDKGETLKEAAIRETAEETRRVAEIIEKYEPLVERYITSSGENVCCYMFFAIDRGESNNRCEDTHDVVWTPFYKVEEILSYEDLRETWRKAKDIIIGIFSMF